MIRRWRAASPPQRRVLAPVLWTGGVALAVFLVAKGFDAAGSPQHGLELVAEALLATVPFGFLVGLLRSRLAQATRGVRARSARLGAGARARGAAGRAGRRARRPVARARLLAARVRALRRRRRAAGRAVRTAAGPRSSGAASGSARSCTIASLADEPQLVRAAGAAAALALENQRLSAELRARIEELRASRARHRRGRRHRAPPARARPARRRAGAARRAGDEAAAGAPQGGRPRWRAARRVLGGPAGEPRRAARARARHPPGGAHRPRARRRRCAASPTARRSRSSSPATRRTDLPPPVATAIYFVVAEALTNVAKYARAQEAVVRVERAGGRVLVEVSDDGVGGADSTAAPACAACPTASPRSTGACGRVPAGRRHAPARRDPALRTT